MVPLWSMTFHEEIVANRHLITPKHFNDSLYTINGLSFLTSPFPVHHTAQLILGQFKLKNPPSCAVIDIYTPATQLQLPDRQQCPQSNSGCYQIMWDYQMWWHWSDPHHGVPELDGIFQWQLQKRGVLGEISPFLATVTPCQWRQTTPAACCLDRTAKIWCQMLHFD